MDPLHVRTALLDFRKAFDLVDHHVLVAKLFSLGIKPLSNVMETATPAGLVFLVMINDLRLLSESFLTWKFADDTTISEKVPSSKQSHLQDAVDYTNNWSQENGLQFNPTKCKEVVTCFKAHHHVTLR